MGLIAPVVIAAGVVAAWQFGPYDTAPAAAGSVSASGSHAPLLGHPVAGRASTAALKATRLAARSARRSTPAAHKAAPGPAASPAAAAPRHRTAVAATTAFTCTGTSTSTSGMLPANYGAIVNYLTGHGYTALAAAGIAGNIYQESKGNPESVGTGGGGLIGWTPLPAGFVTGNAAADLQTQLAALLTYNQQWAQYIPALNAATNATQAADIYMNDFERPGLPAAYNREGAAVAVAQACGIA